LSDIWDSVVGEKFIQPMSGYGFRLVESQETIATMEIVSNLEKQSMLEEMLDIESKPPYRVGTRHLHYLLSTPFRYPPLKHGSRFGGRFESSLFYGGTSELVTLCESAFYRFYFYNDMEYAPDHEFIQSQHTLFKFKYKSNAAVKLQNTPFNRYEGILSDPINYKPTQELGTAMRKANVKAFEYSSSRAQSGSINIALFDASSLVYRKPMDEKSCLCQVSKTEVVFSIERKITKFDIGEFLVNGSLPVPAS